jgi:hypothetical protein
VQLERSDDLVADTSAVPHIHAEPGPLVRESAGAVVVWDLVAGFNPRAPPSI